MKRVATVIVCAVALSACSSASDYEQVMSSFSDATEKARAALESYDKAAATRVTDLRRDEAATKPVGVRIVDGDCTTSSTRCRIVYLSRMGDPDPKQLTVSTLAPEHLAAMREIALYAKALKDMAAADAAPAVKTAVDKALAATTGLASIVAPGASPAFAAFAAPTGQLVVWAFGKYQEKIKVDALRYATTQMEPTMNDAVSKFGTVSRYLSLAELTRLARDLDSKQAGFENTRSRAALDALLAAAQRFDDALTLTPQAVFKDLGQAHTQLAIALAGDETMSLEKAFQMINRLSADAEALYGIAETFRKAAEKKK